MSPSLSTIFKSTRPSFLLLSPICVFLGVVAALQTQATVLTLDIVLVLIAAFTAHISVNTLNEYLDFKSGLDAKTSRTAYSGGSGALVENPDAATQVLITALVAITITTLIGLYYLARIGVPVLPIGLGGIVVILAYTTWISRHPFFCLIAPGLGFGPLMVAGTYLVLTGSYSPFALLISLLPFFLVNNLLLLNQFPDIEADRSVGRNHFPIMFGTGLSTVVYALFVAAAGFSIIAGVLCNYFPTTSLYALLPLAAAFAMLPGILKYADDMDILRYYLGFNVAITLLTPLILGFTILCA